jgi:ribosomal protein L37AE/L43A
METLLTHLVQPFIRSPVSPNPKTAISTLGKTMTDRHTCLCCSGVLLRHVRSGKLYWRCNHCYQDMPV